MKRILPKEITENSIEKIVCEPMDKLKKVPMNEIQSTAMLAFLMRGSESRNLANKILEKQVWTANAMLKRIKAQFDRDIDPRVAALIGLGGYVVGGCILIGYYLQWKANQLGIEGEITMDHFAEKIFPFGLFSENDINQIWDSQKVFNADEEFEGLNLDKGTDNLIDYEYAAQSLFQKTNV